MNRLAQNGGQYSSLKLKLGPIFVPFVKSGVVTPQRGVVGEEKLIILGLSSKFENRTAWDLNLQIVFIVEIDAEEFEQVSSKRYIISSG